MSGKLLKHAGDYGGLCAYETDVEIIFQKQDCVKIAKNKRTFFNVFSCTGLRGLGYSVPVKTATIVFTKAMFIKNV